VGCPKTPFERILGRAPARPDRYRTARTAAQRGSMECRCQTPVSLEFFFAMASSVFGGKDQTVCATKGLSLRRMPSQYVNLMPEDQDLGCQRRSRSEQPDQHRPDKAAGFLHRTERLRDSASVVSPIEFTTGTTLQDYPIADFSIRLLVEGVLRWAMLCRSRSKSA